MTSEGSAADAALFRTLRQTWTAVDPVPADLVDRMVAAVATADLSREYALLTLVEGAQVAAVRGDAEMLTLQFSDGTTSVLIHVTDAEGAVRRIDGWVDAAARSVHLLQGDREIAADLEDGGRFAFDRVRPGLCRLRLRVDAADGSLGELMTPQFEV